MAAHEVDLIIKRGEDYSAYLYWTDEFGHPVVADEYATARMQIADSDGGLLLEFTSTGDTTTDPVVVVLGSSGYIRITCPKAITASIDSGNYRYDLAIDMEDPDVDVFTGKQRHFALQGWTKFVSPASEFTALFVEVGQA